VTVETIIDKFWDRVRAHPDRVALRYKEGEAWSGITWREYGDAVARTSTGLLSLGFSRGDRMCLLASNRPEWFIADIACMSLGGTTAPIYATSSASQVAHIVGHSGSKIAVVEDREQLAKVLEHRPSLRALEKIVVLDGDDDGGGGDLVCSWSDFTSPADARDHDTLRERAALVRPEDVATFVYTSGTTGPPKAVMLTHANIWWTCRALERHLRMDEASTRRALSYLPLSHIAERMVSHLLQILFGAETWFATSSKTVPEDLRACEPTYFFGVPRVWEKFHDAVRARLEDPPASIRERVETALLRRALAVGREMTVAEQRAVARGRFMSDARIGPWLAAKHRFYDTVVLSKARGRAGLGQCRRTFSAAAPISQELLWFFHSMGLKVAEGYGQSETNGPTTWNQPDAIMIGTVGTALPGLQVKIGDDGEILVRGGNVTAGYFRDDAATRDLFDVTGWMCSGDLGEIDDRGYLRVTERKKDLIVTSGGKNIAPQEIENKLKSDDLISEVVLIGEARPFLTALFTLDEAAALDWAKREGLPQEVAELARDMRTIARLRAVVERVNATLARAESIKRFRILPRDFLQEEEEVTPTLKVRRSVIHKKYADAISEMYEPDAAEAAPASP
jgi:long-chain acyl-CoA synthetase